MANKEYKLSFTAEEIDNKLKVADIIPDLNQNDPTQPDYIKNRTHYIENNTLITFDGNIDGRDVQDVWVKVSDNTFTAEQLCGYMVNFSDTFDPIIITESNIQPVIDGSTSGIIMFDEQAGVPPIICVYDSAAFNTEAEFSEDAFENGTYVFCQDTTYVTEVSNTVIHKLDPEYLPEGLPYEELVNVNEPLDLTWDGDTDGLMSTGDVFFKVSDLVLTNEQIESGTIYAIINGETVIESVVSLWDDMVNQGLITEDILLIERIVFVRKNNAELNGIVFPEKGIYFVNADGNVITTGFTTTTSVEHTKTVVHKLDKKYAPNVASNWQENDFRKSGYIENRTHFTISLDDITWDNAENYDNQLDYEVYGTGDRGYHKVSSIVPSKDILLTGNYYVSRSQSPYTISNITDDIARGIFGCDEVFKVVYDSEKAGVPEGTYFYSWSDYHWGTGENTTKITFPEVKQLDAKYLPVAPVAFSGSYNDLKNQPNLDVYATTTNLNNKINEAKEYTDDSIGLITKTGFCLELENVHTNSLELLVGSNNAVDIYTNKPIFRDDNTYSAVTTYSHETSYISINLSGNNYSASFEVENEERKDSFILEKDIQTIELTIYPGGQTYTKDIYLPAGTKITGYLNGEEWYQTSEDGAYTWTDAWTYNVCVTAEEPIKTLTANENGKILLENVDCPYLWIGSQVTVKYIQNDKVKLQFKDNNNGLPSPIPLLNNNIPNIVCWNGTVATSFSSSATGTANDPIIISTADELAYLVKAGPDVTYGKYFKIADNIDKIILQPSSKTNAILALSTVADVKSYFETNGGVSWVGNGSKAFCGNFDGNGVEIYGLYLGNMGYCGLFGIVGANATIKNIAIKNSYMRTGWYAGAIASHIAESYTIGEVTISTGKVNFKNCAVTNCNIVGKYDADTDTGVKIVPNQCIGILLGKINDNNNLLISNCLAYGNNISYEYDNSSHNYMIGYSKNTKIINSALLDNIAIIFNGENATTENSYIDKNTSDIKGDNAIVEMPNLDWGVNWFVPKTYEGQSVPFDFYQLGMGTLSHLINNNTTVINNKVITSINTKEKYTFDWNAMYLIKSNSGDEDITLYNSETNTVIKDGDNKDLPASSLCLLILPKSSVGTGGGTLCMFVGMTGSFSIMNTNVLKGLQFNVASGDVYFTPATNASIFKIAL